MATKRKMRKFADGGFSTAEGQNKMIDDDVRARALRSVMPDDSPAGTTGYGEQNELPEIKAAAKTTSKTSTKSTPKSESKEENKSRMESLVKKQALERVEPESFIPGGGLLKMGLKAITGASARKAAKQLENKSAKMLENKPTRMLSYDKAGSKAKTRAERAAAREEAMKRSNARNYGIDPDAPGSASALESLRRNIGSGEFGMKKGGKVSSYKSGGSVKTSASKRADGCAIRGKTRA
jgi:hypothetical protein